MAREICQVVDNDERTINTHRLGRLRQFEIQFSKTSFCSHCLISPEDFLLPYTSSGSKRRLPTILKSLPSHRR